MNKIKRKQIGITVAIISFITVLLCGCAEYTDINNEVDLSMFLGTWVGNMEISTFGFRSNGAMGNMSDFRNGSMQNMTDFMNTTSANITELEFTVDTLYLTITTENGTQTISNSYTVEGNQIILSFDFSGGRPDWMQPPSNDERPPFDGERPSFNGKRQFRDKYYTYSFNEEFDVLYIDGTEFMRV